MRLRVLIPAVENVDLRQRPSGPRDIYPSRKGHHGRDRQYRCGRPARSSPMRWRWPTRKKPELIVDMATLTGAARVALGPDVPPFYTDDETLASDLARLCRLRGTIRCGGCRCGARYDSMLDSKVADRQQRIGRADALPARSPPRCSCAALSTTAEVVAASSISSPGPHRRKAGASEAATCQGRARGLCAAVRALRLTAQHREHTGTVSIRVDASPSGRSRGDICAGQSPAERYVAGKVVAVERAAQAPLRRDAIAGCPLETEALKGDRVTVYDSDGGRLGLGPARPRRLCRLAADRRHSREAASRIANAQRLRRCGRSAFSRPLDQIVACRDAVTGMPGFSGDQSLLSPFAITDGRPLSSVAASHTTRSH